MKLMLVFILQVVLSLWSAQAGLTADAPTGSAETIVKGDVLYKEEDEWVLKDPSGHEVRVRVTPDTKTDGAIKTGDRIEATVNRDGQASSIRHPTP